MATRKIFANQEFQPSASLVNPKVHVITDLSQHSGSVGQLVTYSANLYFHDGSNWFTLIESNYSGNLTGAPNFDPSSGNIPFTVASGKTGRVDNLNADYLDGYDTSTTATSSAIPVYGTSGVLNVGTPTGDTHAATKLYVDNAIQGLDIKPSVAAATTASITLSGNQTIDGVSITAGMRVLVKDQSTASENGIYVSSASAWALAEDSDSQSLSDGAYVFVENGTTQNNTGWTYVNDGAYTWVQFSGAGQITAGDGLTKTGDTLNASVASPLSISNDQITIADGDISGVKLDSAIAGDGLAFTTGVLSVNVSAPLSISADTLSIADGAIGGAKLNTAIAGDGLGISAGVLSVNVAGPISIVNDDLTIADGAITGVKLNSAIAGNGIGFGSGVMSVNVTGPITIVNDLVTIQDGALTGAKLADNTVTSTQLANSITVTDLLVQDLSLATLIVGSTGGAGAELILDGASNGDGSGGDVAYIKMTSGDDLHIVNQKTAGTMLFATGSVTRATIAADGKVKIFQNTGIGGDPSSTYTLYAYGDSKIGGTLEVSSPTAGSHAANKTYVDSQVSAATPSVALPISYNASSQITIADRAITGGKLALNTVGSDELADTIQVSSLGVGVSPSFPLDVYSASGGCVVQFSANLSNAYEGSTLKLKGGNLATNKIMLGDVSDEDIGAINYANNGNTMTFDVNASTRLTIESDGDVKVHERLGVGGTPVSVLSLVSGSRTLDFELKDTPASGDQGIQLIGGSGDSIGIAAGGTGPGLVLDTSNRLGIRTDSMSTQDSTADDLVIGDGLGHYGITLYSAATYKGTIAFGDPNSNYQGAIVYDHNSDSLALYTGGTSRLSIDSSGNGSITGGLSFPDSSKIKLGSGDDLQIYHDGSNAYIDNNTGQLFINENGPSNAWICGGEVGFLNAAGTEYLVRATSNGSVKLYYDNSIKFETSSTGVSVTGSLDIAGNAAIGSGATRLYTYSDASFSGIYNGSSLGSDEAIYFGSDKILFRAGGSERIRLTTTGLGLGSTNPQGALDLGNATGGKGIVWGGTSGTYHYTSIWSEYGTASLILAAGLKSSTTSSEFIYPFTGSYGYAAIELDSFSDDGIKFYTASDASRTAGTTASMNERMRITTGGDVIAYNKLGVGVSPSYQLDVAGDASFNGVGASGYVYVRGNSGSGGSTTPLYRQGMIFGYNRSNGQGESNLIFTNAGGGNNVRLAFQYWDNSTLSEFLTVSSQGFVGIGDLSPTKHFSVQGTLTYDASTRLLKISNSGNAGGLDITNANGRLYMGGVRALEGSGTSTLFLGEGFDAVRVLKSVHMATTSGSVGIGTSNPGSYKLYVNGDTNVNGEIVLSGDIEHKLRKLTTSYITGVATDVTELSGRQIDLYAYDDICLRAGTGDVIKMFAQGGSEKFTIGSNVIVNNAGDNVDFWVEGDTDTNLLYCDASTNRVGIGTASPTHKLDVRGDIVVKGGSTQHSVIRFRRSDVSAYDFAYIGFENPGLANDDFLISSAGNGNPIKIQAGTSDSISFYGNTTEYARFDGNGRLGVGIPNPAEKLHVAGDIRVGVGGASDYNRIEFTRYGGALVGGMGWHSDDYFYVAGHPDLGPGAGNIVRVYGFGSDIRLGNSTWGDVLTVDDTNGFCGIGTINPANKLTVSGDIGFTGYIGQGSIYGNTGNSSYARVRLYDPATGYTTFNNISYGYYFQTANSTKVTIKNNGNVGIGIENPSYKLHVNGDVYSPNLSNNYTLPNTGNTASWVKLGVLTTTQSGKNTLITISTAQGYNAASSQNTVVDVHFRTSNNSSNQNGFYGSLSATRRAGLGTNQATPSQIRVVQTASSTSEYTFYGNFSTYTGVGSFYTVSVAPGQTWVNSATTVSEPTGTYLDVTPTLLPSGSGVSGRVALWDGSTNITSGGLFYDATNTRLGVGISPSFPLHVNGDSVVTGNTYIYDSNRHFKAGGIGVRLQTTSGYIQFGPQNSSFAHIETDRGTFYFNKALVVNSGSIQSYDEDLALNASHAGGNKKILFQSGGASYAAMDETGHWGLGTVSPYTTNGIQLDVRGNIHFSGATLIAAGGTSTTNIDHIWHNDNAAGGAGGTWNFCSDTTLNAAGNSRVAAGHFYANDQTQTSVFAGHVSINNSGTGTTPLNVYAGSGESIRFWRSNAADLNIAFGTSGADISGGGSIAFRANGSTVNSLTITSSEITLNENVSATGDIDVAGTLDVSAISVNGTTTANRYLGTNSSGTLEWKTASSNPYITNISMGGFVVSQNRDWVNVNTTLTYNTGATISDSATIVMTTLNCPDDCATGS